MAQAAKGSEAPIIPLPAKSVDVGRVGILRSMGFRKLVMDKDYVWKLEMVLSEKIEEIEMRYRASIVFDPKETNDKLESLYRQANGRQTSMEVMTGEIQKQMLALHEEYDRNSLEFGCLDFYCGMIKMENKPLNQQVIQLRVSNKAAQEIAKLGHKLDTAAIVLYAIDEEELNESREKDE